MSLTAGRTESSDSSFIPSSRRDYNFGFRCVVALAEQPGAAQLFRATETRERLVAERSLKYAPTLERK